MQKLTTIEGHRLPLLLNVTQKRQDFSFIVLEGLLPFNK